MPAKKMTATTSTTTGDVDASLVYGSTTEPKKLTKPADSFERAISINEFMQDVHLRFQKDYHHIKLGYSAESRKVATDGNSQDFKKMPNRIK